MESTLRGLWKLFCKRGFLQQKMTPTVVLNRLAIVLRSTFR